MNQKSSQIRQVSERDLITSSFIGSGLAEQVASYILHYIYILKTCLNFGSEKNCSFTSLQYLQHNCSIMVQWVLSFLFGLNTDFASLKAFQTLLASLGPSSQATVFQKPLSLFIIFLSSLKIERTTETFSSARWSKMFPLGGLPRPFLTTTTGLVSCEPSSASEDATVVIFESIA